MIAEKTRVTQTARIFFTCVMLFLLVFSPVAGGRESAGAKLTLIWLFFGVKSLVDLQLRNKFESCSAIIVISY